jgi:hypothetical protein
VKQRVASDDPPWFVKDEATRFAHLPDKREMVLTVKMEDVVR